MTEMSSEEQDRLASDPETSEIAAVDEGVPPSFAVESIGGENLPPALSYPVVGIGASAGA